MVYQIDLIGFEELKINPKYKVNVNLGIIIGLNNKILNTKSQQNKYHVITIGKTMRSLSRLIYEHVHGPIVGDFDVDHIDNNIDNNSINNLQLLTHKENVTKAAKTRDYTFIKTIAKNSKRVKAINLTTNTSDVYSSLYVCQNDTGVNVGIIKMCCDKTNRCKSGTSKLNNNVFTFEYTTDDVTKIIPRKNAKVVKVDEVIQNEEVAKVDEVAKVEEVVVEK